MRRDESEEVKADGADVEESVIDFPKDGLCPEIWEEPSAGKWAMKQQVRDKLIGVMQMFQSKQLLPANDVVCHVTGSITSNQYTENADIDLHFHTDALQFNNDKEVNELNKKLRAVYKQEFIGKHPIEIYYQDSKFQDYMSVGCYSVLDDTWEVGPELTDSNFNPYAEYYEDAKRQSESMANQIRNKIFSAYETSIALKKNIGTEFEKKLREDLLNQLANVQTLYDNIRKTRKVYSSPTSKEEALKFRSSRKWHIADASFKLFDKYGYLAMLKQYIEDFKLLSTNDISNEEVANDIIDTVKNYIGNTDKLMDSDSELTESKKPTKKISKEEAQQYINDFKKHFGYRDEYKPRDDADAISDAIAREYTMEMPTDTAAREIEGEAVQFLVGTDDQESIRCGMKLGDIMMKKTKKHSNEDLLKQMRQAYFELLKHIKTGVNESKTKATVKKISFPRKEHAKLKTQQMIITTRVDDDYDKYLLGDRVVAPWGDEYRVSSCFNIKSVAEHPYLRDLTDKQFELLSKYSKIVVLKLEKIDDEDMQKKYDIISESVKMPNGRISTPNYDRAFVEIKKMVDASGNELLGVKDQLNRGNKCIKLWHGQVTNMYGFDDYSQCELAWNQAESCGLAVIDTFPNHKDLTPQEADEAIANAKEFINKFSTQQIDEGVKELAGLALIASMLAIPDVIEAKTVQSSLAAVPRTELRVSSKNVQAALKSSVKRSNMIGKLSEANVINALARTIYAEANGEEKDGQAAVASAIYNRAGGDPEEIIDVISKRKQFSCWNSYDGGWDEKTYVYTVPPSAWLGLNRSTWQNCVRLATQIVQKKFKSTIGNRNSYLNKSTADQTNVDTWGKDCDLKIGNHHFGYFAYNDGWKSKSAKSKSVKSNNTYVVKSGDTLQKIAKKFGTSIADLAAKNKIKNIDKIQIGQKLEV